MIEILFERADNMRSNPTKSEKEFINKLDSKNIKYKNQYVIGKYIVDFLVGKTIYEIDGGSHIGREEYDAERDRFLTQKGYKVVRILNSEVKDFKISIKKAKDTKYKKPTKEFLRSVTSKCRVFKSLHWNWQKVILQRERLYGA